MGFETPAPLLARCPGRGPLTLQACVVVDAMIVMDGCIGITPHAIAIRPELTDAPP
jgi:hypothetical protein